MLRPRISSSPLAPLDLGVYRHVPKSKIVHYARLGCVGGGSEQIAVDVALGENEAAAAASVDVDEAGKNTDP